jgi:DNA-binding response OmpR family regulator/anti-sigma regulatory factor (Ser/Thr protein kinase)
MTQPLTIFIVDDMPANLQVLEKFLTIQGFEVLIAVNGNSALVKIEKAQPHLILLDILMPGMDGYETCHHLKTNPKTQHIPIIFMTALTDTTDKIKGFELGAVDYITKPFHHEEVLIRIKTHLRINQLQQQLERQNTELQAKNAELHTLTNTLTQRTKELHLTNAKLVRATRNKDDFLANVSHDLRTPLNSILGLTEILQENVYGKLTEKQLKSIRIIGESGHHLLSLINDILDLAKVEAGMRTLEILPISAEEMGNICLRLIKQLAQKQRVKTNFILDQAVTTIMADHRAVKQMLLNLLSNAIKFTPEGGLVTLEIQGNAKQEIVELKVSDTGKGIPNEKIELLFQPFMQVNDGFTIEESQGTGLGLALVSRLAEMHEGSVTVESEVGKGSCFTISLPWQTIESPMSEPVDELTVSSVPKIEAFSPTKPKLILLVDDNPLTLETLSECLKTLGYQVIIAHNGKQAIEEVNQILPDIILMDIQMPEMDGIEAMRRIRANPNMVNIPIIALTALAMPGNEEQCYEAGANDYLSKPVSYKRLAKRIETLLKAYRRS